MVNWLSIGALDEHMRKNEKTGDPRRALFYAELLSDAYGFFASYYAEEAKKARKTEKNG